MKMRSFAGFSVSLISLIALSACSGGSDPTGPQSGSGRIEAGLVGTWIDTSAVFPDTIIIAEDGIRVPFFSAVGTSFSAKDGLVKGGPDNDIFGEYLLSVDTLYYDEIFLETPNGVDKATASKYFRQKPR